MKMKKSSRKRIFQLFVFFVVGLFIACAVSTAQEKSNEELKTEYAPVLGEYEFDWSGRTFTMKFYVEGGALWADSGDGRPVTMKPAGENEFEFTAKDTINGTFEFKFLKDDQDKYSVCHVVNTATGLDTKGTRSY